MKQDAKAALKRTLESLYNKYNKPECIEPDPLCFVWRYKESSDREIVGLLSALMAYGRVRQIHKSLTEIFAILGAHPAAKVRSLDKAAATKLLPFRHRFNTGTDIIELLEIVGGWLKEYGSLENVFCEGLKQSDENVLEALNAFYDKFWHSYRKKFKKEPSAGMKFLLSNPKSAAKRMHLYLRWMVRRDDVDPGVWTSVRPSQLLVPVDTHILRLTRILGFHKSKVASLKTVRQITDSFAAISPDDPVKYDFALSRIGILENCTGRLNDGCRRCELYFYCIKKKKN